MRPSIVIAGTPERRVRAGGAASAAAAAAARSAGVCSMATLRSRFTSTDNGRPGRDLDVVTLFSPD
ncbi:hypothetical protein Kisp01_12530 [Kineosporia sp. NBRC 101677]|nr:hypothetical protein Kisp01_12530 [Kineosporia sp. NBRC 101677]